MRRPSRRSGCSGHQEIAGRCKGLLVVIDWRETINEVFGKNSRLGGNSEISPLHDPVGITVEPDLKDVILDDKSGR